MIHRDYDHFPSGLMLTFSSRGDMRSYAHLIVIVYFFGQAGIAQAANGQPQWQAIATPKSEHVHFYLDKASIQKIGSITSARVLYDFNEPQLNEDFGTYSRSYVVDSYIDCKQQRLSPERMTLYGENKGLGKAQGITAVEKEHKWVPATSGTISGAILEAACQQAHRK